MRLFNSLVNIHNIFLLVHVLVWIFIYVQGLYFAAMFYSFICVFTYLFIYLFIFMNNVRLNCFHFWENSKIITQKAFLVHNYNVARDQNAFDCLAFQDY